MKIPTEDISLDTEKSNHLVNAYVYKNCPKDSACFYVAKNRVGGIVDHCSYFVVDGITSECHHVGEMLNE